MKKIPITQGKFAIVDDDDFESMNKLKWFCRKGRKTYYARHSIWLNGCVASIEMHRFIMGSPSGMVVDHIDGNGLNNQKSNLRICTDSNNRINSGLRSDNKSGYKGVSYFARDGLWWAKIWAKKRFTHLGYFKDKHEAAEAYNEAAKTLHGEYARINNVVR